MGRTVKDRVANEPLPTNLSNHNKTFMCGQCNYCLDKKYFGGPFTKKKPCIWYKKWLDSDKPDTRSEHVIRTSSVRSPASDQGACPSEDGDDEEGGGDEEDVDEQGGREEHSGTQGGLESLYE